MLSEANFKVGQLNMVKVAHEDEIAALREKLRQREEEAAASDSMVTDLQPRVMQQASQIANLEAELEAAQQASRDAERARDEAREQASQQNEANEVLLARLLAEQRATFEADEKRVREEHRAVLDERTSVLEGELERAHAEHATLQQSHIEATQQLAAEADARSVAESELGSTQKKLGAVSSESEQREAECKELKQSVESLGSELHDAKGEVKRLEKKTAELEKKLEPKPKPKPVTSSGVLGAIDLDEGPDAPPISAQIADALRNSSGRVLDLFREWDADGDGEISRKEFHAAMPKLGLEVPKDAVNKLFDEWGGKDGSLEFKELSKILKAPRPAAKTPAKSSAKK